MTVRGGERCEAHIHGRLISAAHNDVHGCSARRAHCVTALFVPAAGRVVEPPRHPVTFLCVSCVLLFFPMLAAGLRKAVRLTYSLKYSVLDESGMPRCTVGPKSGFQ